MFIIYLDSNIFRGLKTLGIPAFNKLNNILMNRASDCYCHYSDAHLDDLKRDTQGMQDEDLRFMELYVNSNYLTHRWGEEHTSLLEQTPIEAFYNKEEQKDIWSTVQESMIESGLKDHWELLLDMKLPGFSGLDMLPEKEREMFLKIVPSTDDSITLRDWMQHFSKLYNDFFENSKTFKDLRRFIIENMNLKEFNVDYTNENFNQDLENTSLGKNFSVFVLDSLSPNRDKKVEFYDFFTTAYLSLNILGIDKEKSRKVRFANTFTDALHAYYAAHCDCLVTNDEGLQIKAKTLYKLLNIETKVYSVDDFLESSDINKIVSDLSK